MNGKATPAERKPAQAMIRHVIDFIARMRNERLTYAAYGCVLSSFCTCLCVRSGARLLFIQD